MNHPFFDEYEERLENLQHQVHLAVEGLPEEALDWTPGREMNSLAILLAHTAGSTRFWIGDVAAGDPSDRVRESEFQTRNLTLAELLSRLDSVIDYAGGALSHLNLNELARERIPEPGAKPTTCAWALLHALEHAYLHLGHIELTSQLWRQRSTP